MKTLNEQIQRLRDILHTCYESIASKGGTLPPVGERNMTNLPDAVESVPQVISAELEELTITQNGEYLPSEGVAGFSKVTAEFDTSSLPKVKVSTFSVTDMCINDDGIWEGEQLIDTSACTTFALYFRNNIKIKKLNADNWNTKNVTALNNMFRNCTSLLQLSAIGWETSNVTEMVASFRDCLELQILDIRGWDASSVTNANAFVYSCTKLQSLIGNCTIEDVLRDNIAVLNNIKVILSLTSSSTLNRASLRAIINGLADLTGQTAQTLSLGATLIAKVSDEDIAIGTNKNWTLS